MATFKFLGIFIPIVCNQKKSRIFAARMSHGVMVALQILILPVKVRILVRQQFR